MKLNTKRNKLAAAVRGTALVGIWAACTPAQALEYNVGEWLFNVDTTLGYSAQWRTENRDDDLEGLINANDGNNSFDDGDMTSSKANIILELGGEKGDFSFFIRGDAMYDYIYEDGDSAMSEENYLDFNAGIPRGGDVDRGDFPDGTLDEHGTRARLLDAFFIYNFKVADLYSSFKAGRQVISWGGSRFWPGINGLQNPNDGAVALAPGVETKEIFLPTTAIDFKIDLTSHISAEAYYKLEWTKTTQPGVGSYLSSTDISGPGRERLLLDPLPVSGKAGGSDDPGEQGQYGVAARYITDLGWNFELAFANAHSNIPGARTFVNFANFSDSFIEELYTNDIKVWAFSVSGNISEAEVYADILYSDNMPFVDLTPRFVPGGLIQSDVAKDEYLQVSVGFTDVYTAFKWLSPSIAFLGEVIYQYNDLGEGDIDDTPYIVTDDSWGYQFAITPRYFNVIQGLDIDVPITFRHDVSGYGNAIALGNGLEEDQKRAGIKVTANYLTNWQFNLAYAWYFDEKEDTENGIIDRDNFSVSVKYRF